MKKDGELKIELSKSMYYVQGLINLSPVKAKNKPNFPCSLGKKQPPPTSGKRPKKTTKQIGNKFINPIETINIGH